MAARSFLRQGRAPPQWLLSRLGKCKLFQCPPTWPAGQGPWRQTPAYRYSPPHHTSPLLTPCCSKTPPCSLSSQPLHILFPLLSMLFPVPHTPLHSLPSTSFGQGVSNSSSGLKLDSTPSLFPDPPELGCMPYTGAPVTPVLQIHALITFIVTACLPVCLPQETISIKMARTICSAQHSGWHTTAMQQYLSN